MWSEGLFPKIKVLKLQMEAAHMKPHLTPISTDLFKCVPRARLLPILHVYLFIFLYRCCYSPEQL